MSMTGVIERDDFEAANEGGDDYGEERYDLASLAQAPDASGLLSEDTLSEISRRVLDESRLDDNSRKDWLQRSEKAIELAMLVAKAKSYPWDNASNIIYPLIATAALEFGARAYPAIVNGRNIAKGVVQGSDEGLPALTPDGRQVVDQEGTPQWVVEPGAKADRAGRIARHLNYQLLEEMPEWEDDEDTLLHVLPIVGCMFKKCWFDPILGRNKSELIWADDLIADYNASNIETLPRIGHRVYFYPYQITERMRSGLWREVDLGLVESEDSQEKECFLEQHRLWDMDGDGYPEPWIVTIHESSQEIVRIRANFGPGDIQRGADGKIISIRKEQYFIRYNFLPSFDGGFYGTGFGHLLENHTRAISTTINQMIDAGTLANLPSGYIGGGLRIRSGETRFRPGEFKRVNVLGGSIRENVVPFDFKGPNPVLFSLLGLLIESGKEIASIKDVLTGEGPANAPATTTLALIEQGMKVFSAIYKRIHRYTKGELKLYARLNAKFLPAESYYNFLDMPGAVAREDYASDDADVTLASDPQMVTDMQRLTMAQALLDWASGSPVANRMEADKRFLKALNVENPEAMLQPPPPDPKMIQAESKAQESQIRARGAFLEQSAKAEKAVAEAHAILEKIGLEEENLEIKDALARLEAAKVELQAEKQTIDAMLGIAQIESAQNRTGAE